MLNNKKDSGTLVEVTRGGQTLSHFLRMLFQIISKYAKIIFTCYVILTAYMAYYLSDTDDLYYSSKYAVANVRTFYKFGADKQVELSLPDGSKARVSHRQIANSPAIKMHYTNLVSNLLVSATVSGCMAIIIAYTLFAYLKRRGKKDAQDEHRRGAELDDKENLIAAVNEKLKTLPDPSLFKICNVPLLPEQECTGILTIGSPSVGKSNAHRDIYKQAREGNHKGVIYDVGGEFIKLFYREGYDVILNPFDERSHSWTLWSEGKDEITYNRLSGTAIPVSDKADPYWTMAPQLIISSLLDELGRRYYEPRMEHFMNIILRMDDKRLASVLAHSDARTIFNIDVEKTAGSLRSVMAVYTRGLKYLTHMKGPEFSFKKWLEDEDDRRWVFIPTRDDMKKTLKEVHTMWFETAFSSILSLPASRTRRILIGLDEFPSLDPLKSVLDIISLGRKQGVVPVLGAQSDSQISERYGDKKATELFDSMGVFMGFRINGKTGAKWVAEQLGNNEVEEAAENYTVAASDTRDAVNVSRTPRERTLMLYSQVQNLENHEGMLRLGRKLPVAKIKYEHDPMKAIAPAFMDSDILKKGNVKIGLNYDNALDPNSVLKDIFQNAKANGVDCLLSWEEQRKLNEKSDSDEGKGSDGGNMDNVINTHEEKQFTQQEKTNKPETVKPLDFDIKGGA
ncbi:type IV secretion system DNA-binding domain-containing protein [Pectobacterium versatile]|uniref:type IV secretion system DNA-binding domain-containing protein n=1 Tax=Pectobacterium versatile TaxID=2488639 RepID=UPI001F3D6260|nr:type IV secretion system DNA-binding domain-containing protein [Pectobacterium versatile]